MKIIKCYIICAFLSINMSCSQDREHELESNHRSPNIIFLLADDLGYGDLSVFGQTQFETPNIDRLANESLKFTQMYSGSTVCAPSRCALISGLHTGHSYIRGNKEVQPEGQYPIPDTLYTIFEFLKDHGYATGVFGKWGLGFPGSEGDPLNQGVDRFYGFNCQRIGHNYYPYYLWDDNAKDWLPGNEGQMEEEYAPKLIQKEALQFIRDNKDQPFFLFKPTIIPHAELKAPADIMRKYIGKYEEIPYSGVDSGKSYKDGGYGSQESPRAAFAAMVEILDNHVGEIIDLLDSLGLRENTVFIFSSDNGPHLEGGADPEFFNSNSIFRGYKRDMYEGGIRVPTFVNWPGRIEPGSTEQLSAFWDIYPTIVELVGEDAPPYSMDGISLLPTWTGNSEAQVHHDVLYWEFHELGGRMALRKGDYKLVRYNIFDKDKERVELYDISKDPSEKDDLSLSMPAKVKELLLEARNQRTPSELFNPDKDFFR